jgi:hypothetical protein
MKRTHTKGDWIIVREGRDDDISIICEKVPEGGNHIGRFEIVNSVGGERYQLEGDREKTFNDDSEIIANAHLIAAAPKLLEALEHVTEWLNKLTDWEGVGDPDVPLIQAALRAARNSVGPPWCCEKGRAANVAVCEDCKHA